VNFGQMLIFTTKLDQPFVEGHVLVVSAGNGPQEGADGRGVVLDQHGLLVTGQIFETEIAKVLDKRYKSMTQ